MGMQLQGTLVKWNDEKGFGFIQILNKQQQKKKIFVHISAFPKSGGRPQINEKLRFKLVKNKQGKYQAVSVERLNDDGTPHFELVADEALDNPTKPPRESVLKPFLKRYVTAVRHFFSRLFRWLLWLALIGGAVFAYHKYDIGTEIKRLWYSSSSQDVSVPTSGKRFLLIVDASDGKSSNARGKQTETYQCNGRTHCSQMGSCEEAKWVLNNCPNTQMDGDGDGIPCERQWCR